MGEGVDAAVSPEDLVEGIRVALRAVAGAEGRPEVYLRESARLIADTLSNANIDGDAARLAPYLAKVLVGFMWVARAGVVWSAKAHETDVRYVLDEIERVGEKWSQGDVPHL